MPIPCIVPGTDPSPIHMSISLKSTVSHDPCPICEHVPSCSLHDNDDDSYKVGDANCGLEAESESPMVHARTDPYFMLHTSRENSDTELQSSSAKCESNKEECADPETADHNQNLQKQHAQQRSNNDEVLFGKRSPVPSGSSSSWSCTNLKHHYPHGYQVHAL